MITPLLIRVVREHRERGGVRTAPKNNESIFARCPQISCRTRLGHREKEKERVHSTKNQLVYYVEMRFFLSLMNQATIRDGHAHAAQLQLITRVMP